MVNGKRPKNVSPYRHSHCYRCRRGTATDMRFRRVLPIQPALSRVVWAVAPLLNLSSTPTAIPALIPCRDKTVGNSSMVGVPKEKPEMAHSLRLCLSHGSLDVQCGVPPMPISSYLLLPSSQRTRERNVIRLTQTLADAARRSPVHDLSTADVAVFPLWSGRWCLFGALSRLTSISAFIGPKCAQARRDSGAQALSDPLRPSPHQKGLTSEYGKHGDARTKAEKDAG